MREDRMSDDPKTLAAEEDHSFAHWVGEGAHAGEQLGHEFGATIGGTLARSLHMGETMAKAAGHTLGGPIGGMMGATLGVGAYMIDSTVEAVGQVIHAINEYGTKHGGTDPFGGTLPPGGAPTPDSPDGGSR
jgi:hypothetical protein